MPFKLPKSLLRNFKPKDLLSELQEYYLPRLKTYGIYSPACVSWNSKASQELRFEVIAKIFPKKQEKFSLIDIGCGVGDLYNFLQSKGYKNVDYLGVDIIPEMVAAAQLKFPGIKFMVADFMNTDWQKKADYLVCSGTLNMVFGDHNQHQKYVRDFIGKMFQMSDKGIAFNLLSIEGKHEFEEDPRFYYADPEYWYKTCLEITTQTKLYTDYLAHDFCLYMLK